ncbi:MAG: peptide chain release factor N(5)-glutamine methyltransferase [Leptospiraceae bacterium]|nr:peptide chain release factor N(5)-glutamine methyltransferase [Leptospiraceae bacterium]
MITLNKSLKNTTLELTSIVTNPSLDSILIHELVLKKTRVFILTNSEYLLDSEEILGITKLVAERKLHKPMAYILQNKEFYGRDFFVNQNVLIPRPETEELIEWVLKNELSHESYQVLDLCAGSGCIGITLQLENPNWDLTLAEISEPAIEVAKMNWKKFINKEPKIIKTDLFNEIENIKFDCIVSNPPYITKQEKIDMSQEVLNHEPELALFVDDWIEFHTKLLKEAKEHLNTKGILYLETNPMFIEELEKISVDLKYSEFQMKKDYSNKQRFARLSK